MVSYNILCLFEILITTYCYSYPPDLYSVYLGPYQLRPAMQLHFRWGVEPCLQDRFARLEALDKIPLRTHEPVSQLYK